ncbi:MAG TPA: hypothetical protein VHK69_21970 [Chitinophagaceae bacterium]|jgi:hypothetical protein|nr:hypothetical protein [Chitinophagaceae bacterium]
MRSFCLLLILLYTLSGCQPASPEKYFDVAVLNTNMIQGFTAGGLERELRMPSVKAVAGSNETVAMQRREVVEEQVQFMEATYAKIKDLPETGDTRTMLQCAKDLYAFALPVYHKEYKELARLYDTGAEPARIETMTADLHRKYDATFEVLYGKLVDAGKVYAEKHKIKVNWNGYGQ